VRWLTPIISIILEVEIKRIAVQSQLHELFLRLSQKYPTQKQGWWSVSSGRVPA
jgi:hypothetical protein